MINEHKFLTTYAVGLNEICVQRTRLHFYVLRCFCFNRSQVSEWKCVQPIFHDSIEVFISKVYTSWHLLPEWIKLRFISTLSSILRDDVWSIPARLPHKNYSDKEKCTSYKPELKHFAAVATVNCLSLRFHVINCSAWT